MTAGIDRRTGRPLAGWRHVLQSLSVIFSTRIGTRILARFFGFGGAGLFGRNLTPNELLAFRTAIAIAIELWEPRFRLRRFELPAATNSPDRLRQGRLGLRLIGDYRPRALEGDFTVETPNLAADL